VKVDDVRVVAAIDTHQTPWSISSGTYSSRFGSVGISAIYSAALKLKKKLLRMASNVLEVPEEELELVNGEILWKRDTSKIVSIEDKQAWCTGIRLPY